MEYGLIPTILSLTFMIILSLVYIPKIKKNTFLNRLYKLYIFNEIFFCVSEIIFVMFYHSNLKDTFYKVFWNLSWTSGVLCWGLAFSISMILIKKLNVNSFRELMKTNTFIKICLIIHMIVPIISLLLFSAIGTDFNFGNNILYIDKNITIMSELYCWFTIITILSVLIKNAKTVSKDVLYSIIIITIDGILWLVLQPFIDEVSIAKVAGAILAYVFYFGVLNPDIAILNEINETQESIEKTSKTKTDFLSNMTYEIKTPMDIISSLCSTLEVTRDFDPEEAKKVLTQITNYGNNLLDVVNNILDISKIETGEIVITNKSYKIKDIIDDVLEVTRQKIGNKPVKLAAYIDQNISSVLEGDASKLTQALLNITTNAAKYTDVGKITFTVTSTKNAGIETLSFRISDTGSGIKDTDKDKLFTKGTRFDNSKESEIEGSGFGLSIAKKHIESMNGKIWFDSEHLVGTTFYIELSQKIIDETPISKSINENTKDDSILDCTGKKLLIVDDNIPNIKVIKRLLEKYNFEIESVSSGQECIFRIKSEKQYDMIFLDHIMPDMDGIETLHVLRNLDGYKLPPIVVLTANALSGMKESYLSEGFDDYLAKPINLNELDKLVKKYFKKE